MEEWTYYGTIYLRDLTIISISLKKTNSPISGDLQEENPNSKTFFQQQKYEHTIDRAGHTNCLAYIDFFVYVQTSLANLYWVSRVYCVDGLGGRMKVDDVVFPGHPPFKGQKSQYTNSTFKTIQVLLK